MPYLPPLPPGASPPTWLLTQDDLDRLPQVSYTSPEGAHDPQGCEAQADALRAEVARLTALLDERVPAADLARLTRERDEARAEVVRLGQQFYRAGGHEPQQLPVSGPGLVTCDGHELRITYDAPVDGTLATAVRVTGPTPALDTDPRRPRLDRWPDDAVTLTYPELRALVALHLDRYCTPDSGRAMREGDVPLRLAEVLDR